MAIVAGPIPWTRPKSSTERYGLPSRIRRARACPIPGRASNFSVGSPQLTSPWPGKQDGRGRDALGPLVTSRPEPIPDPPRYHSNASSRPRVAPDDLPCAISVMAGPDDSEPIDMAFGAGWIRPNGQEGGPLEAVWRLVVRGEALEGRYALRGGVFVELAEET